MDNIPVVDLSKVLSSFVSNKERIESGKELVNALHGFGFVYLRNHGIDYEKVKETFEASKAFFDQPLDKKLLYNFGNSPKGYHGQGYSIKNGEDVFDVRESFNLTGKMKPLADYQDEFHEKLWALQMECMPLVKALLNLLAVGLELENVSYFQDRYKWLYNLDVPSFKTFRTLNYPAIPEKIEIPEGVLRVKEHSDFDFITLLFQDALGGLEIKTKDELWIPAQPISGTIILNIGDLLESWSGGFFPATKHRVIIPDSEIKKIIARQSIAYFLHPDSNTTITPLKSPLIGNYFFQDFKAFEHTKDKLAGVKSY